MYESKQVKITKATHKELLVLGAELNMSCDATIHELIRFYKDNKLQIDFSMTKSQIIEVGKYIQEDGISWDRAMNNIMVNGMRSLLNLKPLKKAYHMLNTHEKVKHENEVDKAISLMDNIGD